jgi:hypothetical protein
MTILCGLNFSNIRIINLNDFSDQKLDFNKDLGLFTIYVDKKNTILIANESYEI